MTAQIPDRIEYQGQSLALFSTPLAPYLRSPGSPRFVSTRTSCWRGYSARWLIEDSRLFLVDVWGHACITAPETGDINQNCGAYHTGSCDLQETMMADVFPNSDRVLADWYSGTLRIPLGAMTRYVHMGFGSEFKRYLLIEIVAGYVSAERIDRTGLIGFGTTVKDLVRALFRRH